MTAPRPRPRSRWRLAGVVAGLASLGALAPVTACYGSDAVPDAVPVGDLVTSATGACAAVLPSGCPSPPNYAATIEPLVQRTCASCHAPGGVAADRDLTTYSGVARLEISELIQLYSCEMPPADAGVDAMLSPSERAEMMQWFVCGYPDN